MFKLIRFQDRAIIRFLFRCSPTGYRLVFVLFAANRDVRRKRLMGKLRISLLKNVLDTRKNASFLGFGLNTIIHLKSF